MTLYEELADAVRAASARRRASGRYLFSYEDADDRVSVISVTANEGLCENLQLPHGLEMKFEVDHGRKIVLYYGASTRPILAGCFVCLFAKMNGMRIVGTRYNKDVLNYWSDVYKETQVRYF